jgi:predicted DsbA family dithiol-disulfide isomerase
MEVDLWTDIVCPWCYIGVSRFERALARSGVEATIRIHPFQLDPEAPIPGEPAVARYQRRFGAEAESIVARVVDTAKEDGLPFDLDRAITANTFDAHRLLQFAQDRDLGKELEMNLYRAYFVDGVDISDRAVLLARALDVGLPVEEVRSFLAGDDGADAVRAELAEASDKGIRGVPAFLFNGEFLVPGAIDEASFARVIAQMSAMAGT